MPYGKIEAFDLYSGRWMTYVRRMEQYIMLNKIDDELKVATLVTLVGERTYNLMCDLCAPVEPEKKSFSELVEIVKNHVEPQTSEIAKTNIQREKTKQR